MKAFTVLAVLSTLGLAAAMPAANAAPALKERTPAPLAHPMAMAKREEDGPVEIAETAVYWCYGDWPEGCRKI